MFFSKDNIDDSINYISYIFDKYYIGYCKYDSDYLKTIFGSQSIYGDDFLEMKQHDWDQDYIFLHDFLKWVKTNIKKESI